MSARTGDGLDAQRKRIASEIGADESAFCEVAVSDRHAALLRAAAAQIDLAAELWSERGEDAAVAVASRLRAAALDIGRITGRTWSDDLLDAVFSRFCVGK